MPDAYGNIKGISVSKELPWLARREVRADLDQPWEVFKTELETTLEYVRFELTNQWHNRNRDTEAQGS